MEPTALGVLLRKAPLILNKGCVYVLRRAIGLTRIQ